MWNKKNIGVMRTMTMTMTYCKRCVMPSTKPDLHIDAEGICNACRSYEKRPKVDWSVRQKELDVILNQYRSKDGSYWDCIIPVSGGKDSTFQVIKMLENKMTPLCVVASTCNLSEIGRKNIENIKSLGVDLIEFSPNPLVRKKLNRIGLKQVGDISWPEHVGIFTIPVQVAVNYKIPLIIWGENSQNEYGGPAAASDSKVLNRRWLEEFGGLLGLRVTDIIDMDENITERDLIPYRYPTDQALSEVGVTGLFLGHYLKWDGYSNALLAQANGFTAHPTAVEGSTVSYENLDNLFHGVHDYFKFLKFGFGRATDQACLHVRRDRMTRDEALAIVKERDGKFPWTYLGVPLVDLLASIDLTVEEFQDICDQFTNHKLFEKNKNGHLVRDKKGNLKKLW